MESITLVFRSKSSGQYSDSGTPDKILKASLSWIILILLHRMAREESGTNEDNRLHIGIFVLSLFAVLRSLHRDKLL